MPGSLAILTLKNEEKDRRIYQLEMELEQSENELRCITINQVTINKELQISFEKLLNEWQDYQKKAETLHKNDNYLNPQWRVIPDQRAKEVPDLNESTTVTIGEPLPVQREHPSLNKLFYKMNAQKIQLLLADDDREDRLLFKKAVAELPFNTNLEIVEDGEELMELLSNKTGEVPTLLFLDIDMPSKNGLECLTQINENEKLNKLSIIIFSGSVEAGMLQLIRRNGAQRYIHKPTQFSKLKQVIYNAINETIAPSQENTEFLYQF